MCVGGCGISPIWDVTGLYEFYIPCNNFIPKLNKSQFTMGIFALII